METRLGTFKPHFNGFVARVLGNPLFFFLKVIFVKIIGRQSKNTCSFFLMPMMINGFNALQFVFCFNEENALRFFWCTITVKVGLRRLEHDKRFVKHLNNIKLFTISFANSMV